MPPAQAAAEPLSAVQAGVRAGPDITRMPFADDDARGALLSFTESCAALLGREDRSGLTRAADWRPACEAAKGWTDAAAAFFTAHFETMEVAGEGERGGFVTGYFEPQIAGVRQRRPGYDVPVYAVPRDLERRRDYAGEGRAPLGRYDAVGQFVPYFERAEIVGGALDGRAEAIGWVADPIDFFFLQIQGSGQLISPEGEVLRIGYAGQNGREYIAIGRTLRERGVFQPGEATMQGIVDWLRANPAEADAVMNTNKSWVFFAPLDGDAPLGALGVPVRPRSSIAADPRFVPLGAPLWLDAADDVADGLWIAQDTGGAIKGMNRFDTFWGAGPQAKRIAGQLASPARAILLVPKGTLARLQGA